MPNLVSRANHRHPVARGNASWRNNLANSIVQNLGGRPRQGPQPHVFQSLQIIFDASIRQRRAVKNLLGGKCVYVNLGNFFLNRPAQVDVKRSIDARRQPGLNANLRSAQIPRFAYAPRNLLRRQEIALFCAMAAAESTEAAALHADVGEIDVAVDHVGYALAHAAASQSVGGGNQPVEIVALGREQGRAVLSRKFAAFKRSIQNRFNHATNPAESVNSRAFWRSDSDIQSESRRYSG